MAKKNELKELDSLKEALGVGVEIDLFLDGQSRICYPITLKDYPAFAQAISTVDPKNISTAFFIDNGEGLRNAISLCFGADMVDEVLLNIDNSNFCEFMEKMLSVCGITLQKEKDTTDKKK